MTSSPALRSLALSLVLLLGAACAASADVESVEPKQLSERLSADAPPVVLDVRTEREWNAGHIEGALHIPVAEVGARLAEIPRDRDVVVHCGVAPRARAAEAELVKNGYERVKHLEGGFTAWAAAGLPVAKAEAAAGSDE